MKKIKAAILGAGNIAQKMARTFALSEDVECYAVASRELPKAEAFARENGIPKAYGSYEEMAADPAVELVYVATPHSLHYEHAKLCLLHGKHVLVEKSFTGNARQARELFALSERTGLLCTEAIWVRYLPLMHTLKEVVDSGIIGTPWSLSANLGYCSHATPRMADPALAGGALLDLGVYNINFASMLFGGDVERVQTAAQLTPTGVDAQHAITLCYRDGKIATLFSSMYALTDRQGVIHGEKGYITAQNVSNVAEFTVYDSQRSIVASYAMPPQLTGFEYEVDAAVKAIRGGACECAGMPHAESLRIMELMDSLRAAWGVRYPFDEEGDARP